MKLPSEEIPEEEESFDEEDDGSRHWFVIHTYSGYENKVKTNLEHRIESMGVGDKIYEVVIPTEEEVEIRTASAAPSSARCSLATCWCR